MERTKEDLRVTRTRKMLSQALLELMEEFPFDKISINEICDKAMVHRATFYNHFDDKLDLLNYYLDEIQEEMFESTVESLKSYSSEREMYLDLLNKVIDFISDNRESFKLIIKANSDKIIALVSTTVKRSIRYLISKNKSFSAKNVPIDVLVNFFTGGVTMIGIDWIESNNPYSKEELLKFFDVLLNTNF